MLTPDDVIRRTSAKRANERVKLFASAMNNLSVVTFATGFVFPALSGASAYAPLPWFVLAIALHFLGHAAFGLMKSED